jgi:hypothetical protein
VSFIDQSPRKGRERVPVCPGIIKQAGEGDSAVRFTIRKNLLWGTNARKLALAQTWDSFLKSNDFEYMVRLFFFHWERVGMGGNQWIGVQAF